MAAKTSSLLDDADFSNIGKSKTEREKGKAGGGGGGGNAVKIAVVIACFLVAGAGLAWNFGLFEPKQLESSKPGGRGALTASEQEAAKKQEQQRKEDLKKPDVTEGPS